MKAQPALIHVDVDSDQTLGRFYGNNSIRTNAVYEQGIWRARKLFAEFGASATFFVNGVDIDTNRQNQKMVTQLVKDHHEIASHTFSHPYGFRRLSEKKKIDEIKKNWQVLKKYTGYPPIGFRAPGYDIDPEGVRAVIRMGHRYDASIYPSLVNPLIKVVLNRRFHGSVDPGYGPISTAFAPTIIHEWRTNDSEGKSIWEVPVSVFPFIRLPFHSLFTMRLPFIYVQSGMWALKALKHPLVFLFHAVEFVDSGADGIAASLNHHPSFHYSLDHRLRHFRSCLTLITRNFHIERTDRYIDKIDKER